MKSARRFAGVVFLVLAPVLLLGEAVAADGAPHAEAAAARECNSQQYQSHLAQLKALVDGCAHSTSTATCDSGKIGPDDAVATAFGKRLVSYAWLRDVLADAPSVKGAEAKAASARDLAAASKRLEEDQELSRALDSAKSAPTKTPMAEGPETQAAARKALAAILAGDEFHHDTPPNLLQRGLTSLRNWIIDRLMGVAAYSSEARWITRAIFAFVFLAACVGIGFWIVRRRRRERLALFSFSGSVGAQPAAEKEWERWSREGRKLAEMGRWREAIHSLYWAAIAALGARGAWPEDRARTPREYLSILRPENVHRADLAAFTRSFEGIWYGHLPANESSYQKALVWLERLAAR